MIVFSPAVHAFCILVSRWFIINRTIILGIVNLVAKVSVKEHIQIQTFPFSTQTYTQINFRESRAYILTVIIVNLTISVIIHETQVTRLCIRLDLITVLIHIRINFLLALEYTIRLYQIEITYGMTGLGISNRSFGMRIESLPFITTSVYFRQFILDKGGIDTYMIIQIAYIITVIQWNFKSFVFYCTCIYCRIPTQAKTQRLRHRQQHIFCFLNKIISTDTELIVQESKIQTQVQGLRLFPSHIHGWSPFLTGNGTFPKFCTHYVIHTFINNRLGSIIANAAQITQYTITGTNFQFIHGFLDIFKEIFIHHIPTQRYRRECAPAVSICKFGRTVPTNRSRQHITIGIRIHHTPKHRNHCIGPRATRCILWRNRTGVNHRETFRETLTSCTKTTRIVTLGRITHQSRNRMIAKRIIIIDCIFNQPIVLPVCTFRQFRFILLWSRTEIIRRTIGIITSCIFVYTYIEFIFQSFQEQIHFGIAIQ